tara:strand:- start:481 stop:741 length:261 start_codon:yes stop_codon:yes gene_type:complete
MNGRKAKQIRKKSLFILVDWIKTLVPPEEAKKLTVQDAYNLMPQQTHVFANRKLMLSAFSLKWITKKIKRLIKTKELNKITLKDLL